MVWPAVARRYLETFDHARPTREAGDGNVVPGEDGRQPSGGRCSESTSITSQNEGRYRI